MYNWEHLKDAGYPCSLISLLPCLALSSSASFKWPKCSLKKNLNKKKSLFKYHLFKWGSPWILYFTLQPPLHLTLQCWPPHPPLLFLIFHIYVVSRSWLTILQCRYFNFPPFLFAISTLSVPRGLELTILRSRVTHSTVKPARRSSNPIL